MNHPTTPTWRLIPMIVFIACFISACHKDDDETKTLATVSTGDITSLSKNAATIDGIVTNDGHATVTARGTVWSTSENPTVADSKTTDGTGTGTFSSSLTGLTETTTYFARAYATNAQGTAYGNQITFSTDDTPVVTTGAVSDITKTTATVGGEVTFDGNSDVTERGIVWSVNHNPTTTGQKISSGTGTGEYTGALTGLTTNTTYYARAYATNSEGTSYGTEVEILTYADATINTETPTDITSVSAWVGGQVTFEGNTPVVAYGVCWSVNHNPTTSGSFISMDISGSTFTAPLQGLTPSTVYYARSYATNAVGTTYGNEVTVTTTDIYAGLKAFYTLDNTLADNTGNNAAMTSTTPAFVADRHNNANSAIFIDGTNASNTFCTVAFGATPSTTMSFWFNAQGATGAEFLVYSNRYQVYYGLPSLYFVVNGPTNTGFATKNGLTNGAFLNTWHHFVGVYDGHNQTMFIDGVQVASTTFDLGLNFGNLSFEFGGAVGSAFYTGAIDEVKMFDRPLTSGEVEYLFNH